MTQPQPGVFVNREDAAPEQMPGRMHYWYSNPEQIPGTTLLAVRCVFPAGQGHPFHHHPKMEELLYVLSGKAEQWLEKECRTMKAGDMIQIRPGVVHATYNGGDEDLEVLAILSPADSEPPGTVQVEDQAPWNSLRSE